MDTSNVQAPDTGGIHPAVQEALARRGLGQQAPMMDQGGTPPLPSPASQMGAPMPQGDKFVPKDTHELLVSTLAESLKNEYKLKSEEAKFGQAPMV